MGTEQMLSVLRAALATSYDRRQRILDAALARENGLNPTDFCGNTSVVIMDNNTANVVPPPAPISPVPVVPAPTVPPGQPAVGAAVQAIESKLPRWVPWAAATAFALGTGGLGAGIATALHSAPSAGIQAPATAIPSSGRAMERKTHVWIENGRLMSSFKDEPAP